VEVGPRKSEGEPGSTGGCVVGVRGSGVAVGNVARDGQSQSRAVEIAGAGLVEPGEQQTKKPASEPWSDINSVWP
jgi:hypothetical protein